MKSSAITSPRTPPIAIRSPTVNVFPRRMTKHPANDVITFVVRAKRQTGHATKPRAVASLVGSSNQMEIKPKIISKATIIRTPWCVQNDICRLRWLAKGGSPTLG